jgi:SAM-dependent methyltransferase
VSGLFVDQLRAHGARRVLEVGAGIGASTERLLDAGFEVAPLEPNPVLHAVLEKRLGIRAYATTFEAFDDREGAYDAVLAEGVFYALGMQTSVAKLQRLLRPGGLFAAVDLMWTDTAKPDAVALIHDQTKEVFGIPMAPREIVTSSDWARALRAARFSEVFSCKIDPHADAEGKVRRLRVALGLLLHPELIPLFLTYRLYGKISWTPPGWLESWATVWTRP